MNNVVTVDKKKKHKLIIILVILVVCIVVGLLCSFVVMGGDSKKLQKQLDFGNKYLGEMDYERALVEFETALKIDPMNVDAYLGIVEVYIRTGEYEKAYKIAKEGYEATGDSQVERKCNWLKLFLDADKEPIETVSEEDALEKTEEPMPLQMYSNRDLSVYLTDYLKYSKSDFDVEKIDYQIILDYVYAYVSNEAADAIKTVGTGEWIPQYLVNNITEKTYGCVVPEQNFDYVTFADGGFLYPALGIPGFWGMEYAIIDTVTEENGVYQVSLLDTSYLGAEGKSQGDLDAIYEYTADQVRENNDFEILGTVSCTLKNDGANLLMQKLTYTPVDKEEDTTISATDLVRQEIPELQDLFQKIYELSSQQAGVSLWEEDQQVYDSSGNMHDCTMVYVGESWPEHVQVIYIFAVEKKSNQIYWYDQESDALAGIDQWRAAAAYWFQ